jgi:hypothetical protein
MQAPNLNLAYSSLRIETRLGAALECLQLHLKIAEFRRWTTNLMAAKLQLTGPSSRLSPPVGTP